MTKKEYNKEYYKKNKKYLNEMSKKYSEKNKEKVLNNKKEYYTGNKDSIIKKVKKYYESNKSIINEKRKKYRKINKEKVAKQSKKYQKKRLSTVVGKLKHNIRQSIRRSLISEGYNKKFTSEQILGCNIDFFKSYIESKFEPWMNWNNKGLYNGTPNFGWDLDHIIPLSTASCEEEVLKLNHYKNIQPLCSYYNRDIKRSKI